MLKGISFTDVQGTNYTDAVVSVRSANRTFGSSSNGEQNAVLRNDFSGLSLTSEDFSNDYDEIQMELAYWPTQSAYEAGYLHYTLANPERSPGSIAMNQFTIDKEYIQGQPEGASLEEICDDYFTNVIKPKLGGQ